MATNVEVYDYLNVGYIYNDGDNLPGWTQNGNQSRIYNSKHSSWRQCMYPIDIRGDDSTKCDD